MGRFLSFVQGALALIAFMASFWGWPLWVALIIGIGVPFFLGVVIVFLRGETPKGRVRELIEGIISLALIIGISIWCGKNGIKMSISTPKWIAWVVLPSILFNLSIIPVYLFHWGGSLMFFFRDVLMWVSGEKIGEGGGE